MCCLFWACILERHPCHSRSPEHPRPQIQPPLQETADYQTTDSATSARNSWLSDHRLRHLCKKQLIRWAPIATKENQLIIRAPKATKENQLIIRAPIATKENQLIIIAPIATKENQLIIRAPIATNKKIYRPAKWSLILTQILRWPIISMKIKWGDFEDYSEFVHSMLLFFYEKNIKFKFVHILVSSSKTKKFIRKYYHTSYSHHLIQYTCASAMPRANKRKLKMTTLKEDESSLLVYLLFILCIF